MKKVLCVLLIIATAVITISLTGLIFLLDDSENEPQTSSPDYGNDADMVASSPAGFTTVKTDNHGVEYIVIEFSNIAESVDLEDLPAEEITHFYNDAPWMPDWGHYIGSKLVEKTITEQTKYRDAVHVHNSICYLYDIDDDAPEVEVATYMRILRQAGYELYALGLDRVVYQKGEMYIMLMQIRGLMTSQISITTADGSFGV